MQSTGRCSATSPEPRFAFASKKEFRSLTRPLAALCVALAMPILCAGCVPVIVAGAAGTALVVTDRRSTGAQLDDQSIEFKIAEEVRAKWGDRAHASATSYNGVVLLTGEVPTQADKAALEEFARSTERVRSVQNELVVAPPSELGSRSNDAYITSLVKTRLLENTGQYSPTHVKVLTDRGVVYLMGIVRRPEGDAAARTAASTHNVQRVVKVFEYMD
jgi:osmotically-inducible protein OsmY